MTAEAANLIAREAQEALQKTRVRLLAFLEHAPEAIFIKDAEGRYTEISGSFLAVVGRSAEEVIGKTDDDLFGPEVGACFRAEDDQVRATGQPTLFEESLEYGGRRLSFLTRKFPLPGGEVAGIATDVTERLAEREAHAQTAERLRLAIEGTGLGVYENNLATGEGFWSESAFRVLGLEPTPDLRGSYELWRTRVHPEDLERAEAEHAAAHARGGPWSVQYRVIHPDEEVRWVSAYGQFTRRGEADYSTGIAIDITDQKRLEQQQALLVSELNHRVKNMLAVVQSIAAQTFKRDGDPAEQRRAFDDRLVALARVHDLLQRDSGQPVGVRAMIEQAISPFNGGDRTAIACDGPDFQLETRKCVSLALALHELCTNAVKYGALSTRLGRVDVRWSIADGHFHFDWRESGGPPVQPASRTGFGTRMLERALSSELGTRVKLELAPDGARCRFSAPLHTPAASI